MPIVILATVSWPRFESMVVAPVQGSAIIPDLRYLHFNVTEVIDTLLMVYGKIALKHTQKPIDALSDRSMH